MVVVWLRKCRDLGPPWDLGEAAFLLVHGQIHYRDQLLARLTGFLPTMFDERNHYSRIVFASPAKKCGCPNFLVEPSWLSPNTVRRYPHDAVHVHAWSVDLVRVQVPHRHDFVFHLVFRFVWTPMIGQKCDAASFPPNGQQKRLLPEAYAWLARNGFLRLETRSATAPSSPRPRGCQAVV